MARLRSKPKEKEALARLLRDERERAGLTADRVEERTGIHPATLSLIENAIQEPTLAQLRALARVYGVPVRSFFAQHAAA
jgi:transcriptional regulator with XRE-family HTH domain